jgi:hypothetical protein
MRVRPPFAKWLLDEKFVVIRRCDVKCYCGCDDKIDNACAEVQNYASDGHVVMTFTLPFRYNLLDSEY